MFSCISQLHSHRNHFLLQHGVERQSEQFLAVDAGARDAFQKKEPKWRWLETKIQSCRVLRCTRYQKECVSLWDCRQFLKPPCTAQSQVKFSTKRDPYVSEVEWEKVVGIPLGQYDARRQLGEVTSSRASWACHCRQWSFGFAYRSTVVVNVCSSMDTCETVSKQQRK